VPGANPLGPQALHRAGQWWRAGPCVREVPAEQAAGTGREAD